MVQSAAAPVMRERSEAKLFKFENPGDVLAGILIGCQKKNIGDKPTIQFAILEEETGDLYAINATYQIASKLRWPLDKGHKVEIAYIGEDRSVTRNGNAMKQFRVKVSQQPVSAAVAAMDELKITDEDIPF